MQVGGFYDDVVGSRRGRGRGLGTSSRYFDETRVLGGSWASYRRTGEAGPAELLERLWADGRGCDVNGIWGGYAGEGAKTVIAAKASAKLSCRLVPDQDGKKVFEQFRDYVLAIAPRGVRVEVENLGTASALRTDVNHPIAKAAARALEATFGMAPVSIRSGGSIPVAPMFGIGPRAPGRDARLHESRRQRPRSERDDGPLEL